MPEWTKPQLAAITTEGTDILVSAAAGSGKTAALTERIIRHVSAGGELYRMLIVTFSRASAADMKAKLGRELRRRASENPNDRAIARALSELPSARIGTIHSFCSSLLRRYYGELSLPARSRIADDAEAKLMKTECMDETLDYFFSLPPTDTHDPETDFVALTDHLLGGESDEALSRTLLSIYEKTSCLPKRYESLVESAEELRAASCDGSFLNTNCGGAVSRHIKRGFAHYTAVFTAASNELSQMPGYNVKHLPSYEYILRFLSRTSSLLEKGSYDDLSAELSAFAPPNLGSVKGEKSPRAEYFKSKKTEFTAFIKSARENYFAVSADALAVTLRRTAAVTLGIVRVLREFDDRYKKEKRRRGALDYEDLEHYALRLLSSPETAAVVASEYDEIYVDECQDVNAVQNSIFEALSRHNRFMVGDVKQSIYAFRGADPTLFDGMRQNYRPVDAYDPERDPVCAPDDGASIFMSDNFRCDDSVIRFTNAVCGKIMPHGNVSYTENDALRHGKTEPDGDGFPVKIVLCDPEDHNEDEKLDPDAVEPNAIANEIALLLREGKKRSGEPITPGDIAVLLRSTSGRRAERIEDACRKLSIPVSNDTKPNFFECPEVLLVLCLLHTINNPLRDVYLAGALRSPVFGFTLSELIAISEPSPSLPLYRSLRAYAEGYDTQNSALREKCRAALDTIRRWREEARCASAADVIAALYKETGIESLLWADINRKVGSVPTETKAENLSALYEYARTYEKNSLHGLHRFLDYISAIIERGVTSIGESASSTVDSVRIMTSHQSKGLEFPVVILAYCGSDRNTEDSRASLVYHKISGLAMKLRADDEGESPIMLDTLPRRAVADAVAESLAAEEMRILYVALTRAKERLVVTAKCRDAERFVSKRRNGADFFDAHTVYTERSYIGWILSSLFSAERDGEDVGSFCSIVTSGPHPTVIVGRDETALAVEAAPEREKIDEYKKLLRRRIDYVYPYARLGKLPAKLAVSALYPTVLDEDATPLEAGDSSPLSPEAEAAAKAGTATHLYMQFCDFARAEKLGVRKEAERMVESGFIRSEDAALIRFDEVEAFLHSHIYEDMKRSRRIWRERRFNIRLPAADFTLDAENKALYQDEELLVQGVMDCFFENEHSELILLDYKTDRLSPYELSHRAAAEDKLRRRHSRQLSYYSAALLAMFGKAPSHVYIYSLPLGDTVEVTF